PRDVAFARCPVPVGKAVGILQVDVRQHVAGGFDIVVDRRRAGGDVSVVGVASVEGDADLAAFERLGETYAIARILVLDVLDDDLAADGFTGHNHLCEGR